MEPDGTDNKSHQVFASFAKRQEETVDRASALANVMTKIPGLRQTVLQYHDMVTGDSRGRTALTPGLNKEHFNGEVTHADILSATKSFGKQFRELREQSLPELANRMGVHPKTPEQAVACSSGPDTKQLTETVVTSLRAFGQSLGELKTHFPEYGAGDATKQKTANKELLQAQSVIDKFHSLRAEPPKNPLLDGRVVWYLNSAEKSISEFQGRFRQIPNEQSLDGKAPSVVGGIAQLTLGESGNGRQAARHGSSANPEHTPAFGVTRPPSPFDERPSSSGSLQTAPASIAGVSSSEVTPSAPMSRTQKVGAALAVGAAVAVTAYGAKKLYDASQPSPDQGNKAVKKDNAKANSKSQEPSWASSIMSNGAAAVKYAAQSNVAKELAPVLRAYAEEQLGVRSSVGPSSSLDERSRSARTIRQGR